MRHRINSLKCFHEWQMSPVWKTVEHVEEKMRRPLWCADLVVMPFSICQTCVCVFLWHSQNWSIFFVSGSMRGIPCEIVWRFKSGCHPCQADHYFPQGYAVGAENQTGSIGQENSWCAKCFVGGKHKSVGFGDLSESIHSFSSFFRLEGTKVGKISNQHWCVVWSDQALQAGTIRKGKLTLQKQNVFAKRKLMCCVVWPNFFKVSCFNLCPEAIVWSFFVCIFDVFEKKKWLQDRSLCVFHVGIFAEMWFHAVQNAVWNL